MRKLCPLHFLVLFCLLLACSAVAASSIEPFVFRDSSGSAFPDQDAEWQRLIKYKLWGTGTLDGVGVWFSNNKVSVQDSSGYSGSAVGDLVFVNNEHSIGGPLAFGGSFKNGTGDDYILTGPSHFSKEININGNASAPGKVVWNGLVCAEHYVNFENIRADINESNDDCSNPLIPKIDADLDVPVVDWGYKFDSVYSGNLVFSNKVDSIVIPAGDGYFDMLVDGNFKLDHANDSLYIVNPNGRMVRIFIKGTMEITSTLHNILVKGAGGVIVENSAYAGNLLFYTPNAIEFPSGNCLFQGTYISGGLIWFKDHYRFAGQLLAKKVQIHNDFDAGDFRYVPFNPPKLTVKGDVYEDNAVNGDTLRITLNKIPPTKVTFKYCFNVKKITDCPSVSINDASYCSDANVEDFQKTNFPICGDTTFEAFFNQGDSVLATPIVVHAVDDNLTEDDEDFSLVISDLSAAVYVDGDRYIDDEYRSPVSLIDNDAAPLSRDTTVIARVNEKLSIVKFPALLADGANSLLNYTVYIESVPAKGTLTYNGTIVNVGDSFDADPATGLIKGLEFQPATGDFGAGYAGIEFTVSRIGNPVARSEKYTMTIDVVNISFEIEENTIAGTPVGNVEDLNISGNLSCSILNGNTGNAFAMGIGSEIDVNGKLDFETLSSYSLLIKCDTP